MVQKHNQDQVPAAPALRFGASLLFVCNNCFLTFNARTNVSLYNGKTPFQITAVSAVDILNSEKKQPQFFLLAISLPLLQATVFHDLHKFLQSYRFREKKIDSTPKGLLLRLRTGQPGESDNPCG